MLDKKEVEKLMEERGYIVYAYMRNKIQFVSRHMYHIDSNDPVINVIVNLENSEFGFIYNIPKSINQLITPTCSPVTNEDHFNKILRSFMTSVVKLQEGA